MPVKTCEDDGRPGYRWGSKGKCYTYETGDEAGRKKAKEKIDGVDARKRFLIAVFQDETIRQLLAQDKMEEAESAALRKLDNR